MSIRDPTELMAYYSKRDIAVLFGRVGVALGFEHAQGGDEVRAGIARLDDRVNVTALSGDARVGKFLAEFVHLFAPQRFRILGLSELARLGDSHSLDRPLTAHSR